MKNSAFKRTISALLATGFLSVTFPAFAQEREGKVIADSVNLRKEASIESTVLCALPHDTTVTILDINGNFYKVRYGNVTGYIATDYLEDSDPVGHIGIVNTATVNLRKGPGFVYDILRVLSKNDEVRILSVDNEFYQVSIDQLTGYIQQDYITVTNTLADDDQTSESVHQYGYVNTNNVNMRSEANSSSVILYQLKKDTKVFVTEKRDGYYSIEYNGHKGFIADQYITIGTNTTNTTSFSGKGAVNTDSVNMRERASTSSGIMFTLTRGTVVNISGIEGDFYKVSYNGRTGYIVKNYLTLTTQPTSTPYVSTTAAPVASANGNGIVISDTVNMREKASTDSGIMYTLPRNTVVKITGTSGDFYKVQYNDKTGYIVKTYLSLTTQAVSTPKPAATATPAPVLKNGSVNSDTVNMREKASTASGIMYTLPRGTVVKITASEGDFYKVSYNGKTGYIVKTYLTLTNDPTSAPVKTATSTPKPVNNSNGYVSTDTLNMREQPSTGSAILYVLTKGTVVKITGETNDFYKISYNCKTGYVAKQYLTLTDQPVSATTVSVTAKPANAENGKVISDTVNMREHASTASEIISVLTRDTVVKIMSVEGDFYKVTYNGRNGYIYSKFLSLTSEPTTAPKKASATVAPSVVGSNAVITADKLNMRSKASTSAEVLYSIEKGTVVRISAVEGDFYKVSYNGKTGYVSKQYTSITSNAVSTPRPATPTPAPKTSLSGSGRVNGATVNVRSAASTSSDALFQLPAGTIVTVTALEGNFYKIRYNNSTGYISKDYLLLISGNTATPAATAKATAKPVTSTAVNSYGKITPATLNIR